MSHDATASDDHIIAIQGSIDTGMEGHTNLTYSCPMHPNEMSHLPGRCAQCGMNLTKQHQHAAGKQNDTPDPAREPSEHEQASLSTLYACPMHPKETSRQPGSCPLCGMFLVKNDQPSHDSSGHTEHQQNSSIDHQTTLHSATEHNMANSDHEQASLSTLYACPMHPKETSRQPGSCPLCGMFLVKNDQPSHDSSDHAEHQPASHSASEHNMMNQDMAMPAKSTPERFWESKQSQHRTTDKDNTAVEEDARLTPSRRLRAIPKASPDMQEHSEDHSDHDHMRQNNTYICPMHPQIVTDELGSCPICGMDLVLKEAGLKQVGNPQVFLSSAVIQNMGIRTMTVERNSVRKAVKTQGVVTADDERIHYIHPRTGGWVERLYPITEGDRVERKDELIDFYSPWINQAQLDFITALEEYDLISYDPTHKAELEAKVDALRNTLRLLNVSPMDLMRIEKNRKVLNTIQLMAPHGGLITELSISEGSFVEPYQSMFTIVDLSEVWVMVDIYEHQAPWVRKGHQVTIMTPTIPGRKWTGEVEFIYPEVNPKTRTLRARIEVLNPDEALLINMFVHVDLTEGTSKENIVTVPREAIMLTGEREIIVKSLGKGHFQPVEVKTGIWGDGRVEILSGISEGDEVVVSGQFLIDSESNLQSSLLRISE
ncbi:MAG: efflux RND transporter periplasmic adaptor subunit [Candidatus Thiodiazotropha sp. (ex Codakia rugifera)]|nr:efflux RND transporter periplasmic adaptor subunit [Candidatus Thiodiazotropha sp. (ex Codakia rugifera)]